MGLIFCWNDRIMTTEISGLKTLTGICLHGGIGNYDVLQKSGQVIGLVLFCRFEGISIIKKGADIEEPTTEANERR